MQMQEPEQRKQVGQAWQANQEYDEYNAGYSARYESEQEHQQKIYPQEQYNPLAKVPWIITVVLSAVGFFLAVAGIIGSAVVLQYTRGDAYLLTGGAMGLLSSIAIVLVCIAIFVTSVIMLTGRMGTIVWRMRNRLK